MEGIDLPQIVAEAAAQPPWTIEQYRASLEQERRHRADLESRLEILVLINGINQRLTGLEAHAGEMLARMEKLERELS